MIAVNTLFFNNENHTRLSLGVLGTLVLHVIILIWLAAPVTQKIITVDQRSAPTNVSIRLISPLITPQKPIERPPQKVAQIKPVVTKKIPQKVTKKAKKILLKTAKIKEKITPQTLNDIKPAAARPPQRAVKTDIQKTTPARAPAPVQKTIPVVSDTHLKGRRVQPAYPDRALRSRQEGVVWLRVLISETGKRQDIKLHKPSQYALLNQAALKAVKKWTFDPNVVNGHAIKTWVEIPIEFKLQNTKRR